jgi:hypothetical protein
MRILKEKRTKTLRNHMMELTRPGKEIKSTSD